VEAGGLSTSSMCKHLDLGPSNSLMSGLLFENNKHAIAKVRENANRHGGKNATITK